MNQADLIAAVAERAGLTKADAGKAVEALVGTITEALQRGDEVRIAGFGSFGISERGSAGPQSSDRRGDHDRGVQGRQVHRRQGRQGRPQRGLSQQAQLSRERRALQTKRGSMRILHRRPPLLKTEGPGSGQQPTATRFSARCP